MQGMFTFVREMVEVFSSSRTALFWAVTKGVVAITDVWVLTLEYGTDRLIRNVGKKLPHSW